MSAFWNGFLGFPKPPNLRAKSFLQSSANLLQLENRATGRAFYGCEASQALPRAGSFVVPPSVYMLWLSAVAGGGGGGGNNATGSPGGGTTIYLLGRINGATFSLIGGEGGIGSSGALAAAPAINPWQNKWPGSAASSGYGGYGADSMFGPGALNQGNLTSGGNYATSYGSGGGGSRTSGAVASSGGASGQGIMKYPAPVQPGQTIDFDIGNGGQGNGATAGGYGGPGFVLFEW